MTGKKKFPIHKKKFKITGFRLAAIHFNENAQRPQGITRAGQRHCACSLNPGRVSPLPKKSHEISPGSAPAVSILLKASLIKWVFRNSKNWDLTLNPVVVLPI